jgi:hypothetical protein
MARSGGFSAGDMAARMAAGVALVLLTYNPSGYSYVEWFMNRGDAGLSALALVGVILLIAYVIFIRATLRAMSLFGVILAAALIAAFLWVLVDNGVLRLDGQAAMQWAILIGLGLIMGIGLSWSHVRRALSGQSDVDDVGD